MLPADLAPLVELAPELAPSLPAAMDVAQLGPASARFRLFEAIHLLLQRASQEAPILVVLDDLHWADEPSLDLLRSLTDQIEGARLAVLGTFREDEISASPRLAHLMSRIERRSSVSRIRLCGLAAASAMDLARSLARGKLDESALIQIAADSDGNPFFIEELTHDLLERCDLLVCLGEAEVFCADTDLANGHVREAMGLARGLDEPELFGRAVMAYRGVWGEAGAANAEHVALLEEALQRLPPADSHLRIRLMGRLATELYWTPQ